METKGQAPVRLNATDGSKRHPTNIPDGLSQFRSGFPRSLFSEQGAFVRKLNPRVLQCGINSWYQHKYSISSTESTSLRQLRDSERMAHPTDISNVRIAKEGPMPGYTGHIPGVKSHVMGHSFSDASKRGVAITETLRHNELGRSIHLGTENRVANQEQDFHAELSRPDKKMDPRALMWRCSAREAPKETRHASGKVDLSSLRLKEWGNRGPEYHEVNQGDHCMKGYTGHTHAEQHVFGKTYGQTTRELRHFPAEPSTSGKYIYYAENRPLVINEFELRHPMRFPHNVLLKEGEGTLGPLPEGVGASSTWKLPSSNDSSQFMDSQKGYYDGT